MPPPNHHNRRRRQQQKQTTTSAHPPAPIDHFETILRLADRGEDIPLDLAVKIIDDTKRQLHEEQQHQKQEATTTTTVGSAIATLRALSRKLVLDINSATAQLPPDTVTELVRSAPPAQASPQVKQQYQLATASIYQKSAAGLATGGAAGWRDSSTDRDENGSESGRLSHASSSRASDPFPVKPQSATTAATAAAFRDNSSPSPSVSSQNNQHQHGNSAQRAKINDKKKVLALCLNNLACAFFMTGDASGAAATLSQAAALERDATADHTATMTTLCNLVAMWNAKAMYEKARKIGDEAVALLESAEKQQQSQQNQHGRRQFDDDTDDEDSSAREVKKKSASYAVSVLRFNFAVAILGCEIRSLAELNPANFEQLIKSSDEKGLNLRLREALRQLRRARDDALRVVRRLKNERELSASPTASEVMSVSEKEHRALIKRIDATIRELVQHAEKVQDLKNRFDAAAAAAAENDNDANREGHELEQHATPGKSKERSRRRPQQQHHQAKQQQHSPSPPKCDIKSNNTKSKGLGRGGNPYETSLVPATLTRLPPVRGAEQHQQQQQSAASPSSAAQQHTTLHSAARPTGRTWLEEICHYVEQEENGGYCLSDSNDSDEQQHAAQPGVPASVVSSGGSGRDDAFSPYLAPVKTPRQLEILAQQSSHAAAAAIASSPQQKQYQPQQQHPHHHRSSVVSSSSPPGFSVSSARHPGRFALPVSSPGFRV